MAFRLMRYAIAAMQRHLESGQKRCLWLSYSSIRDDAAPILVDALAG